ncbi:hypothetical protein QZH41_017085, partial [Actinostola sp. cb2023]
MKGTKSAKVHKRVPFYYGFSSSNKCCKGCCACPKKMSRFFEKTFGGLGHTVASFPWITIAVSVIIVGTCAVGFMFAQSENRVEKLYIPPDSMSLKHLDKASRYFPQMDTKKEVIIFVAEPGKDVLSRQCFLEILQIHNAIISLQDFHKHCVKAAGKCIFLNPLEVFNFDEKKVDNISETISKVYNSPAFLMRSGRPLRMTFSRIFGHAVWWKNGTLRSASAVQVEYLMSDRKQEELLELEDALIKKVFEMKSSFTCAKVYLSAGRSLSDATAESTGSDIVLFSITFTLMITFACVSLLKFKNPLAGHALLAQAGILAIGLGILAGLGLSMFIGIPFISFIGILPFLILGIGIDDMFIMLDELDRIDISKHSVSQTVKLVMSHSGPTITMTTLTDLVAFAVSTSTQFPAIRYFCIYAALTVTFAYLMLVTFFVALLTFDVRRIKAGRRDFCPVCRAPPEKEGNNPWTTPYQHISSYIMQGWGKVLMLPAVRVFVVLISLGLLGVSIFYALKVNEDFDRRLLAKKGASILDFFDAQEMNYGRTVQVSIVIDTQVGYETSKVQSQILELSKIATDNTYYMNMTVSWMEVFKSFTQKANLSTIGSNFMPSLKIFLEVPSYAQFKQDVVFSAENSSVVASRVLCFMKPTSSSVSQKDAMLTMRSDLALKSELSAYPITKTFIYLEQYAHIKTEAMRNIAVAGAAVFILLLPFLLSVTAAMLVCLGFGAVICELFALMYVWDVALDMISTINLVMAIGFSVDYSAHVAHAYVRSTERTPEDRVIHALSTVGASVFMGGASTFVGIVVTAFASSAIFVIFFKMFLGIIVLGLVHGLCFLPVYLSLLYRWAPVK